MRNTGSLFEITTTDRSGEYRRKLAAIKRAHNRQRRSLKEPKLLDYPIAE